MRKQPLGCITTSGILTAVIVALAIFGFWTAQGGAMFNPAPLSTNRGPTSLGGVYTHAEILRIPSGGKTPKEGILSNNCAACHTAPWESSTSTDRCMVCHANLASPAGSADGDARDYFLVMMVSQTRHNACIDCHTEHRGEDGELTKMDLTDFDHLLSGFSLQNHQRTAAGEFFTCRECHGLNFTAFDQVVCTACHTQQDAGFVQEHTAEYGADCLACHDGKESYGRDFDHNQVEFKLSGKHGEIECRECHENPRSAQDLTNTARACFSCHEQEDNHQGEHGMKCGFCHTDVTWTGASLYHENSIFQLTGIHRQAACADCHPDRDFSRKLTSCYGCHQEMDEHNGKFGQTCSTCHSPTSWSMASFNHIFGIKAHGGIYRNDECRRCHGDVFKGTPDECEACHSDPAIHAGMFKEACSTCHTPAGWIPAKYFAEHTFPTDHGRDFASTCETCHPFSLNDYTCYGCHEHNQAVIEARYRERGVEDFADCMRCHPLGEIDPEMKLPGEIDAETDTSPN